MKSKSLLILLILGLFTTGTILSTIKAQEKETRPIPDIITSIKITSGLDLYVSTGDKVSLIIEADKSYLHRVITEVQGHQLRIYTEGRINWKRTHLPKIYVTLTDIESIVSSGGSDVFTKGVLKSDSLVLKSSSGSDMYANVDTHKLFLRSSSGSDLKVEGKTINLNAKAESGSDIIAENLAAKYVTVKASAGSDARVYAIESIDAHSSSGADIIVYGSPTSKNLKESSGGDIRLK
jgi:hypothetical protein